MRFSSSAILRIKCFCENLRNLRETNLKLDIFVPKKPDKIYYRKCLNLSCYRFTSHVLTVKRVLFMSTKRGKGERYSTDFKLRLLEEFHAEGSSQYAICKKYGVGYRSFTNWVRKFEAKLPSLPDSLPEVEKRVYMGRVKSKPANQAVPMTEAERLRAEVERLRKALAYSELRNEALGEVLRIGREEYGVDLLKKAGAKQ